MGSNKFREIFKKDPEAVAKAEVLVREEQAKLNIDVYVTNAKLDVIAKERELDALEDQFAHGDKNVLGDILTLRADLAFLREQPKAAEEYKTELFAERKTTTR